VQTFRVEIAEPAEADIEQAHDWLNAESAEAADRWIDGLLTTIEKLRTMPRRCPLAPENSDQVEEIRQLLYGQYRILFTVDAQRVIVLHVRHGARMALGR
jgi:plasmid stabilization system protein ParE